MTRGRDGYRSSHMERGTQTQKGFAYVITTVWRGETTTERKDQEPKHVKWNVETSWTPEEAVIILDGDKMRKEVILVNEIQKFERFRDSEARRSDCCQRLQRGTRSRSGEECSDNQSVWKSPGN